MWFQKYHEIWWCIHSIWFWKMAFQVILNCLIELLKSEFFASQPTFVNQTFNMSSIVLLKQETTLCKLLRNASQVRGWKERWSMIPPLLNSACIKLGAFIFCYKHTVCSLMTINVKPLILKYLTIILAKYFWDSSTFNISHFKQYNDLLQVCVISCIIIKHTNIKIVFFIQ